VYQESFAGYFLQENPPEECLWQAQLPRRGWAWEFLRRSAAYQADYQESLAGGGSEAAKWGLLHFCDPALDATIAPVLWRPEQSSEVLLLTASREQTGWVRLDLNSLPRCAFRRFDARKRRHDVLIGDRGRFLQLAIFGDRDIGDASLLVSALGEHTAITARAIALRRLNDVLCTGSMCASLYPAENRARRLSKILIALDGSLSGLNQREIAKRIVGSDRVEREWNHPSENLRDQVRRAVSCGQQLMTGGYRQFLRLTFGRRIAFEQGRRPVKQPA